jgi:four helix bundle protein
MMNDEKKAKRKFDLEERTSVFAENVIGFCKKLPNDPKFLSVVSQLIRAVTSVGANYCEADDAQSKKDFIHKISLCKKESRETKYWLRIISSTFPTYADESNKYLKEAQELNLIFAAIIRNKK